MVRIIVKVRFRVRVRVSVRTSVRNSVRAKGCDRIGFDIFDKSYDFVGSTKNWI